METLGREVKQQEQKKTNVRKFISVVKKYTDMTQLDATILREFVEQIRVSDTYTTDEQQKRVKIREIEIVYNFIGAFDFEGAREQYYYKQGGHGTGDSQKYGILKEDWLAKSR